MKSEEILHLLEICLRESSFKFRGQFYEMTNGLAMGCPVSPIVANIFMEEKAINDMPSKPSLWLRFVDDVLAIVKRRALQVTLETLNAQHDDITTVYDGSGRERTATIFGRQNRAERQPAAHLRLPEANGHR